MNANELRHIFYDYTNQWRGFENWPPGAEQSRLHVALEADTQKRVPTLTL